MNEEHLVGLAAILGLGMAARWLAWKFHLPSILLLLLAGIAAGPVTGFLDPNAIFGDLLLPIVSISVGVILFEGGLSLNLRELREIGGVVRNLITIGVVVTWSLASAASHFILGLDPVLAILFGAVLVVTGPTVIIPLLQHVRPVGQLGRIVKWEGILNDPIGALLAVLVFEAILAGGIRGRFEEAALQFLGAVLTGCAVGVAGAGFTVLVLKFYWIPDFLQNTFSLAMVVAIFTASNHFQPESGLLATTTMGVALANQRISPVKHIVEFKENLRILMISSLFIVLAARLRPQDLADFGAAHVLFLVVLFVVVRPVTVGLSTLGSKLSRPQRVFLACLAPRGIVAAAVASIFSSRLSAIGYQEAQQLVPLTFLVIIATVLVYGLGAFPLARRLGVAEPRPQGVLIVGAHPWARKFGKALLDRDFRVVLVDSNWAHISAARLEGFPTHYGGILSERVLGEIDLYGIGRLMALTSNDEANSLAALHFGDIFGRAEVYQLAPEGADQKSRRVVSPQHLSGRFLFRPGVTYSYLAEKFASGYSIKGTKLSEQFNYKAFQERYGSEVVPLFCITSEGNLTIYAHDRPPAPKPGQTLLSLIPFGGESEKAEEQPDQQSVETGAKTANKTEKAGRSSAGEVSS